MSLLSFLPPSHDERLAVLPSSVSRSFVQTPDGQLELLRAEPPPSYSGPRLTPVFFAHGGCGSAAVWLEWMGYLSQVHNIPCYAVSYRGHGGSWYPWYLRMYFTTARALAGDLIAGFEHAKEQEKNLYGRDDMALVAHSNGGGLAQIALSAGDVHVAGLALVAATPCYGSVGVNKNWTSLDKWFIPRMYFKHLGNPMSPLSTVFLVKQAFFSSGFPLKSVEAFRRNMPTYESFLWPLGLMLRVADPRRVLSSVKGWDDQRKDRDGLLLIAGEEDKLMSLDLMERQAAEYTTAALKEGKDGVRYEVVKGAAHHLQNDLQWKVGAKMLVEWYQQL